MISNLKGLGCPNPFPATPTSMVFVVEHGREERRGRRRKREERESKRKRTQTRRGNKRTQDARRMRRGKIWRCDCREWCHKAVVLGALRLGAKPKMGASWVPLVGVLWGKSKASNPSNPPKPWKPRMFKKGLGSHACHSFRG